MSFSKYEKYKDSGVEWLGEVPEHWEVSAIKHHFQIVGGSTPKSEMELFWDGDILWATPSDLSKVNSLYLNDTQRKITPEGLSSCGTTLVPPNSIILSTRAPIGSIAIAEVQMCTNQGCKSLVPTDRVHAKYFYYLLSVSSTELNVRGKGTTFLELSSDELGAFKVPISSLTEQINIVSFLDRETVKIDELVAEQQRLIELLKEKRQAVISHAVTRGLNPNAPMKPSGIEWLGDVPAHWGIGKLNRLISTRKGIAFKAEHFTAEGVAVVKASDIKILTIRQSDTCLPVEFLTKYPQAVLKTGEIILSTVGSAPEVRNSAVGQVGKVPDALSGSLLNQNTVVFTTAPSMLTNEYLFIILQTIGYRDHLDLYAHGTANQASINVSDMLNFAVPLPSLIEQNAIDDFIATELAKLDTLHTEAKLAISLLQERRTALTSAAVTGKIDVRQFNKN